MIERLLPAVGLAWAILAVLLIELAPADFHVWCIEDGPQEWAQAALFLAAGVGLADVARRSARHRPSIVALAALSVLVWLEEISWGQRILDFETPASMRAFNRQNEFNLHNAEAFQRWRHGLLAVFGVGGLVLVALRRGPWERCAALARRLVPPQAAINFLLVLLGIGALLGGWLHFDPDPLGLPNPAPGRMLSESLETLIAFTWAGLALRVVIDTRRAAASRG